MLNQAVVVIADIVGSSAISPPERVAVQGLVQRWCGKGVGFKFTGGDEFEWRMEDAPSVLDEVLLLRARLGSRFALATSVSIRCGIGRGEVVVESPLSPYAEDGPAYHRARDALNRLSPPWQARIRSIDRLVTGQPQGLLTACNNGQTSTLSDALWLMMDSLMETWTPAQWNTIRLMMEGESQTQMAKSLGISVQSVSKRLRAARVGLYLEGLRAVKENWWRGGL